MQVIFQYNGDSSYTMTLRHDLVMQMPGLKKKYLKYNSYKNQTVHDIFNLEKIKSSYINYVYNLKTSAFINNGSGFSPEIYYSNYGIGISIGYIFNRKNNLYPD